MWLGEAISGTVSNLCATGKWLLHNKPLKMRVSHTINLKSWFSLDLLFPYSWWQGRRRERAWLLGWHMISFWIWLKIDSDAKCSTKVLIGTLCTPNWLSKCVLCLNFRAFVPLKKPPQNETHWKKELSFLANQLKSNRKWRIIVTNVSRTYQVETIKKIILHGLENFRFKKKLNHSNFAMHISYLL